MTSLACVLANESQTEALGEAIGQQFSPGLLLLLNGPLGAGKTRLSQAMARGAGAAGTVLSPTFGLLHAYPGPIPVYHIDAYRLRSPEELFDLGLDTIPPEDGACVLEWGDRVADILPRDSLRVELTPLSETSRHFVLTAGGKRSALWLNKAMPQLSSCLSRWPLAMP